MTHERIESGLRLQGSVYLCGLALSLVLILSYTSSLQSAPASRTIFVDINNTTGIADGTQAHPFTRVQVAIDFAQNGDTILVEPGYYLENVSIRNKEVTLRSQLGPSTTVLDGGDKASTVFMQSTPGNATIATIDGFTIRNGGGPAGDVAHGYGIMIGYQFVTARILHNIIRDNRVRGGISIETGLIGSAYDVLIANNLIVQNGKLNNVESWGGGISINAPNTTAGAISIENNIIAANTGKWGGGIQVQLCCNAQSAQITIRNNTIYSNSAQYLGGGVDPNAENMSIINNIVYANVGLALGDNDIVRDWARPPADIRDNIIGDGQLSGVNGNFASDPLFVDPSNLNFHLQAPSPAIDAGTAVPLSTDFEGNPRPVKSTCADGAGWDIGAYEYQVPSALSESALVPSRYFALPGDVVTFTVAARNNSPTLLNPVQMTDTLPAALTYSSGSLQASSGTVNFSNGVIDWNGSVSASSTVTISYVTTLSTTTPLYSTVSNSANIRAGSDCARPRATLVVATPQFTFLPLIAR